MAINTSRPPGFPFPRSSRTSCPAPTAARLAPPSRRTPGGAAQRAWSTVSKSCTLKGGIVLRQGSTHPRYPLSLSGLCRAAPDTGLECSLKFGDVHIMWCLRGVMAIRRPIISVIVCSEDASRTPTNTRTHTHTPPRAYTPGGHDLGTPYSALCRSLRNAAKSLRACEHAPWELGSCEPGRRRGRGSDGAGGDALRFWGSGDGVRTMYYHC